MKKFSSIIMPLFNSNKANFKIDLQAKFTRQDQTTKQYRDLVYVGEKYEAMINPSIYLALSCKVEGTDAVYIGYPQLRKLRKVMATISDLLEDNKGFIEVDGVLTVNPQYAEPFIIDNIGQKDNWISFKLGMSEEERDKDIIETIPVVWVGLKTANGYTAAISAPEFWTIETIINEINLTQFKWDASLAYLDIDYQGNYYTQGGYQQPQPVYQQPQPVQPRYYNGGQNYQNNYYNQNQQQGYQRQYQPAQPAQPIYNQQGYQRQYQQPQQPVQQPQVLSDEATYIKPAPQQTRTYQPQPKNQQPEQQQLPPRENTPAKGIMNFSNVANTPVAEETLSLDDSAAVDAIFGDNAAGIFGN